MDKVKKAIKTDNLKKKIYKNDRKNTVGAIVRDDGNDDGNNALFEKIQKLKDTAIRTRDQKKQQNKSSDLLKKIQSLKRRARRRHSFRLRGIAEYLLGKRKRNLMREDFIQKLETLDSRYEIISQEDAKELLRQNVEKTKHSMSAVVRIYKSILDMEKQDQHISRLETLLSRYKQISTKDTKLLLDIDGTKTEDLVTLVEKIYDKIPKNTTFCLDFDGCSDVQDMLGDEFDLEYAFKDEKILKPIIHHALFGTGSNKKDPRVKQGQWLRDNTPALKEISQKISTSKSEDTITIITGSNRQSEDADNGIAQSKEGITCNETLMMITDVMAKNGVNAKFSTSLLSEFDGNERFTEGCLVDDSKVLILIKQMHEVASKNPDKKIHEEFIFLDDRIDILKGLKEVFSKHPEYIPKGMELKLQAAATGCWMGDNKKFPTEVLFGTGPILDHQEVEEIYLAACDHVNSLKESMNDERLGTIRIPLFCRGFNEKLKNFNMKKSYIRSKYIETIEQKYKTVQEQKVLKKIQMLIKKAKARKNSPTRILASIITNITKTENQDKARDEFIKNLENLENLEKQYKQISAEDAVLLLEVDEEKTASSSGQVTSILEKLSEQKYKKEHEQKYKTVLEHIARPKSKQANKDLSGYGREAEKQQDAAVERLKDRRNKKNESTGVGPRITPDKGGR